MTADAVEAAQPKPLQWGRAHVSAEMSDWWIVLSERDLLQWGRAHVSAEMPDL